MKALGLIEVKGYLGAICSADAALKAADVKLIENEQVGAGLNTIKLVGDVAAVQAAVEAGKDIAEKLECLITYHVISRLDLMTEEIVYPCKKSEEKIENINSLAIENETDISKEMEPLKLNNESNDLREGLEKGAFDLNKFTVAQLRKILYKIDLNGIDRSEIKYTKKVELIDMISKWIKEGGDLNELSR